LIYLAIDPKPNTVPVFYEIPGVQNFFYSPFTKFEEINVQSSPWLEPFKIKSVKELPPLSHVSAHTAADSRGDQTGNQLQFENDISQSLCYLVKKLNLQLGSQPKNLDELLQRSFMSMPSHSILQSPRGSALPSPFITHTSTLFQGKVPGSTNDLSLKGSSFRKSPFVTASKTFKPPVNVGTDEGLILQIADLINRDDGRIRSAISELLAQYGGNPDQQKDSANKRGIFGEKDQGFFSKGNNAINPFTANPGDKPKTISLSNGLTMNLLNRSPKSTNYVTVSNNFNIISQNTKIEAARKELFVISENDPKSEKPKNKQEPNDFNLFDFLGETTRSNLSPLISSGSLLKGSINMNNSGQPYFLTSHSMSQQTASLSTNSSHSGKNSINKINLKNYLDNQRGGYMSRRTDMMGKPLVSSTFRLNDDILLQTKILNDKFTNDFGNIKDKFATKNIINKTKSPGNKNTKTKPRNNKKAARAKGKKVSVEEYIRHVNAREESNLTIDETWEESEDWDDIEVNPEDEKPRKALPVS